jgi:hypothetical protein
VRPLFTIHAGEYLVASEIERRFRLTNVWVPSRDTGVDLLVTDRRSQRSVSLQVKFSKDFLTTHMEPAFQKQLRGCGWWTIDRQKLAKSPADYWVFVLQGFANRSIDFVIVPPRELARRLTAIHGRDKKVHTYLWVTEDKRCWETRGMRRTDQLLLAHGEYVNRKRDFTAWLNNWTPVQRLNRGQ